MSSSRARSLRLPAPLRSILAPAVDLARREGTRLFLVCGAVRDRMLRRPVRDVDLAVEGDAIAFASRLARATGGELTAHGRFGTAKVVLPSAATLDLATARRETYSAPAALPAIEPAPIEEDLARRDFTINALAIELAPSRHGRLLDPFGGEKDLTQRLLRMLHPRSAFDDPTRAFRAVRFANRLGFRIEVRTRRWIREALRGGAFDALSGDRLRREIRLIFSEPRPARAVRAMGGLGLASALSRSLRVDAAVLARLRAAERIAARHPGRTTWLAFLLAWAADLEGTDAAALARRLSLDRRAARTVAAWPETLASLRRGAAVPADISADELVAAAASTGDPARRRDLTRLLEAPPALSIRGRDLLRAGVPAGPAIGRALSRTRDARRSGEIPPERELEYALAIARERGP